MDVARVTHLDVLRVIFCGCFRFVVEGIHRSPADIRADPSERLDGPKERTRYQHEFQVERSSDVLHRREARIADGPFKVRNLTLPESEFPSQRLLAELFSLTRVSKHGWQTRQRGITKT